MANRGVRWPILRRLDAGHLGLGQVGLLVALDGPHDRSLRVTHERETPVQDDQPVRRGELFGERMLDLLAKLPDASLHPHRLARGTGRRLPGKPSHGVEFQHAVTGRDDPPVDLHGGDRRAAGGAVSTAPAATAKHTAEIGSARPGSLTVSHASTRWAPSMNTIAPGVAATASRGPHGPASTSSSTAADSRSPRSIGAPKRGSTT